jgi:putative transposase
LVNWRLGIGRALGLLMSSECLLDKAAFLDFVVEVTDTDPGFKVIPRRWVVERSIGWLTRYRRLVRDYEQRLDVSEAMIFLAMGNLLLRRITRP